jgi:hypothetical protein
MVICRRCGRRDRDDSPATAAWVELEVYDPPDEPTRPEDYPVVCPACLTPDERRRLLVALD